VERSSLKEVKKDQKMQFSIVGKTKFILTRNSMNEFLVAVHELFYEFVDIVVDALPHSLSPIRSISHHIDLILRELFPKKETYILTP
jgi:hypothetical protein